MSVLWCEMLLFITPHIAIIPELDHPLEDLFSIRPWGLISHHCPWLICCTDYLVHMIHISLFKLYAQTGWQIKNKWSMWELVNVMIYAKIIHVIPAICVVGKAYLANFLVDRQYCWFSPLIKCKLKQKTDLTWLQVSEHVCVTLRGAKGVLHKLNRVHVTICMVFPTNWIQLHVPRQTCCHQDTLWSSPTSWFWLAIWHIIWINIILKSYMVPSIVSSPCNWYYMQVFWL